MLMFDHKAQCVAMSAEHLHQFELEENRKLHHTDGILVVPILSLEVSVDLGEKRQSM